MSSLCLLSVDDVYEQDGLAAECLMVHKIKPRLSAAQRLPSGSHVVEACWEYKFRAHGQVNAPPLSPAPRPPIPPPRGPARPTVAGLGTPAQPAPPRYPNSTAWPRSHQHPHPIPRLGTLSASGFFPLDPRGRERPLSPGRLCIARRALGPGSLSPYHVSWGPCFAVTVFLSLSHPPAFTSPSLLGCIRRSFRLLRSPSLPLSPLLSPGAGGHRTAAWHQQSMTKTLSFCC